MTIATNRSHRRFDTPLKLRAVQMVREVCENLITAKEA